MSTGADPIRAGWAEAWAHNHEDRLTVMRAIGAKGGKNGGFRRVLRAPVISAACILASALMAPTMVRAFSNGGESLPVSLAARGALGSFTPASVDPRLVAQVSIRALSHGRLFRFTPAGMDNRPDRAVTVAVRLPDSHDRLIASRVVQPDAGAGFAAMRIAPVAYNLGVARGYQSFALPTQAPIHDLARDGNELRAFSLAQTGGGAATASPRLGPNVDFEERNTPGRSPRTLGTQGDYEVSLGGSYRLMGNLDVTAGLRDSSDRDRLLPLSDHRQDNQAVYVGTKFRF
jgi:hypothetical protein